MLKKQRDKQSPDASVAIQERVDRLELHVCEARLHQRRQRIIRVNPLVELRHERRHIFGRRGHEPRVAGPRAADPVLGASDLARLLLRAAHAAHEPPMRFAEQT